jgi:hypothetical protein
MAQTRKSQKLYGNMAALEQFADSEDKMTEFLIKYNFITKFDA